MTRVAPRRDRRRRRHRPRLRVLRLLRLRHRLGAGVPGGVLPVRRPRWTARCTAFAIFALAFIARPIGTLIFMAIQRHFGRERQADRSRCSCWAAPPSASPSCRATPASASPRSCCCRCAASARAWRWAAPGTGCPRCWRSTRRRAAAAGTRCWPSSARRSASSSPAALFAFLLANLSAEDFLRLGLALSLLRRLRDQRGGAVRPAAPGGDAMNTQRSCSSPRTGAAPTCVELAAHRRAATCVIGAFAALASYALFHLVTVFPLSWVTLYSQQAVSAVPRVEMVGARPRRAGASSVSGCIADRIGRRRTLGALAIAIARLQRLRAQLLDGGDARRERVHAGRLRAAGPVLRPGGRRRGLELPAALPLHRRGADRRPRLADRRRPSRRWSRSACRRSSGWPAVSLYLLSGAVCTLVALTL